MPVAFSESCRGAARYAASMACRFGSELNLIHVDRPIDHGVGLEPTPAITELARIQREWAEREMQKLLDGHGCKLNVSRAILAGDPGREIVAFSRNHRGDLIIMPTHGHGPFRRFLMGSVTSKVLHDAMCPVLTGVHMENTPLPDAVTLRTIACAVDLGDHSRDVLAWAAEFAAKVQGRVVILHVLPAVSIDCEAVLGRTAREEIDRYREDLDMDGSVQIGNGDVVSNLCWMARQASADLIVIGRGHGRTVAGRLPSKTYAIARTSHCPVVSV